MQQREAEWFAARAGAFTASRAGDLMAKTKTGLSALRTNIVALLAVERLTGSCVETYQNAAMARGVEMEAEALAAYSMERCVAVESVAYVEHPTIQRCGCSPDGYVGADGLVEVKCPMAMGKHVDALMRGSHADEYKWQLQHQMMVTGRRWVDAVSYDPRFPAGLQLAIRRVQRNEKMIAELVAEIAKAETEVEAIVENLRALQQKAAA